MTRRPNAAEAGRPRLALVLVGLGAVLACTAAGPPREVTPEERVTVGILVDRAERAWEQGDLDGAVAAYREALERTPWNSRLRRVLATAYAARAARARDEEGLLGLEAAERDLRAALELEPDDPEIRRNLAVVLVERAGRDLDPERAGLRRAEARTLDSDVASTGADRRADLERRLDLAYQLVERGQTEAGIERLEMLHTAHPEHRPTTRLLARALVYRALGRAERGRHAEAGALLDRAVALYTELSQALPPEETDAELRDEIRTAHRNRVVTWLNASRPEKARRAIDEAERAGLRFPELSLSLPPPSPRAP